MGSVRSLSRRSLLVSGFAAARLFGEGGKGTVFPADSKRYSDPATELDVFRLTDPSYTSTLPAFYNRAIARNDSWLIFSCDRTGSPQAFRMDLKTAQTHQLTAAEELDPNSLTLTPDNRSFCFFAGRTLLVAAFSSLRQRELYTVPEGWERLPGFSVGPDGTHATFCESRGENSRLRMVTLGKGVPGTVVETSFSMSHPIARPMRAQILYRQGNEGLWLVNSDGQQNRKLKLAGGRIGPADWAPDGKTLLYLNYPEDPQAVEYHPRAHAGYQYRQTGGQDQPVRQFRLQPRYVGLCWRQPQRRIPLPVAAAACHAPGIDRLRAQVEPPRAGGPPIFAG